LALTAFSEAAMAFGVMAEDPLLAAQSESRERNQRSRAPTARLGSGGAYGSLRRHVSSPMKKGPSTGRERLSRAAAQSVFSYAE
jgi:hypothetical protein